MKEDRLLMKETGFIHENKALHKLCCFLCFCCVQFNQHANFNYMQNVGSDESYIYKTLTKKNRKKNDHQHLPEVQHMS